MGLSHTAVCGVTYMLSMHAAWTGFPSAHVATILDSCSAMNASCLATNKSCKCNRERKADAKAAAKSKAEKDAEDAYWRAAGEGQKSKVSTGCRIPSSQVHALMTFGFQGRNRNSAILPFAACQAED